MADDCDSGMAMMIPWLSDRGMAMMIPWLSDGAYGMNSSVNVSDH